MIIGNSFDAERAAPVKNWLASRYRGLYDVYEEATAAKYVLRINPKNPRACRVMIASQNGSTQIHFGERVWFDEVDYMGAPDGAVLDSQLSSEDLVGLVDVVAQGLVREVLYFRGEEEVGSDGWVKFKGKEFAIHKRKVKSLIFRPTTKRTLVYEPYCQMERTELES